MPDEKSSADPRYPDTDEYDDVVVTAVQVPARSGQVPALLYRPKQAKEGESPCPAVVIGVEAFGVNEFSSRVAATLAHRGYVVIVPDYYRGDGPTNPESYTDFTEVTEFIGRLDFRRAALDMVAAVEYLELQDFVDKSRVAVWGYCTGGTLAMLAACLRTELAAAILFFPSQPVFPELDARRPLQPVDLLWNIGCPVMFIYGDQDAVMAPERLADLRQRLEQWDIDHTIAIYPGAGHAFSAPVPPLRHDAADRASWVDAVRFLDTHLDGGG
jgi:carboxymethylenebutenolidase